MTRAYARAGSLELVASSAAIVLITAAAVVGRGLGLVAPLAALLVIAMTCRFAVVEWRTVVLVLLLIVLFVPIRRYLIALNLPFQLEPYRVYVMLLAALWASFLLIDRRLRIRSTGLEAPLALLGVAILGSILTNLGSITDEDLASDVIKKLTFWFGFMIVLYMIASLLSGSDVKVLLEALVVGAAVLGALGVLEWQTGNNMFSNLDRYIPFIAPGPSDLDTFRAGATRAYGSAQHPIAFGAVLALVLPIAAVLAFRRRTTIWFVCTGLIVLGTFASVSRTSMVMLLVAGAVLAALKPRAAKQAVPYVLPLLVVIQIAMPGSFSTTRQLFQPEGGLVRQQAEQNVGSGRVASFGPAIDEASRHPLFGRGFGTRIVGADPRANSFILDDEWLTTTLEIGLVGALAWAWIYVRFCSKAMRAARRDDDDSSWLLAGLVASVAAFAVGMVFFDAFAFIQVTIVMIMLLGFGAVLLNQGGRSVPA